MSCSTAYLLEADAQVVSFACQILGALGLNQGSSKSDKLSAALSHSDPVSGNIDFNQPDLLCQAAKQVTLAFKTMNSAFLFPGYRAAYGNVSKLVSTGAWKSVPIFCRELLFAAVFTIHAADSSLLELEELRCLFIPVEQLGKLYITENTESKRHLVVRAHQGFYSKDLNF